MKLHQKITLLSFYQTVIDMYVRLGRVEKKCSLGTKPKLPRKRAHMT
jgi:hypothetical protein